jgi:FkbH-like protein
MTDPASTEIEAVTRQAAEALESASLSDRLAAFAAADPVGCASVLVERMDLEPQHLKRALRILGERGSSRLTPALCAAVAERWGTAFAPEDLTQLLGSLPVDAWTDGLVRIVDQVLARSPRHAGLLRLRIGVAVHRQEHAVLDECLDQLVVAEPSWATAAFAAKTRRRALRPAHQTAARIALLSSYTIDPLVPFLENEIHGIGASPEIYVAPFNTWAREVVDPSSRLRAFDPKVAVLAVALDDLVSDLSGPLRGDALRAAGEAALGRLLDAAEQFSAWSGAVLVVHGFWSVFGATATPAEARVGPTRPEWIAALNARLAAALRELPRAHLFDVGAHLIRCGGGDDAKMRHLAGMRLPQAVLPSLARAMAGYVAPSLGLTRKCVVVDLDNTLWGGIVGEDGPSGIRLGNTAPGSEFVEFQRFLKSLSERGILLAVNSKNNPGDAAEVLQNHPAMVLREADFSAIRINWKPKPENMASIAQELNLGLDSLVFVDDNPDEREQMRQMLPEVLTVDLPPDPARYRALLESLPQLQVLEVTAEDRARATSYRAQQERTEIRRAAASLEEYLASLEISIEVEPVSDRTAQRVAQLFQRTNQFNVTTRRYDVSDVQRFARDPGATFLALHARDRFGDHGLVAVVLARDDAGVCLIDSLLMSCRVIGYGIETALLCAVQDAALEAGADRLAGEFIPTSKNGPARDLYDRHGLVQMETVGGVERWECKLPGERLRMPPWIARKK